MNTSTAPDLFYLWHPGTHDIFSGYGLVRAPARLVGLVIVDRPKRADPAWLAEIRETFGAYQLTAMTHTGERGMICQMHIANESLSYLRSFDHPLTPGTPHRSVTAADPPTRRHPGPALGSSNPLLDIDHRQRGWAMPEHMPKFLLGQIVATPGALAALSDAQQSPLEFLSRHQRGDWGELDEEDKQENEYSVANGFRILSAHTLTTGVRIWIITEADRSVTTILLPNEY